MKNRIGLLSNSSRCECWVGVHKGQILKTWEWQGLMLPGWEIYSCKFTRFCPQCFKCLEISILTTERAACERRGGKLGGGGVEVFQPRSFQNAL